MSIIGGLRTLFGGRVGIFSDLCESAREESFQLCYGTAVVVEPLQAHAPTDERHVASP